jgi:hypothetical protein
VVHDDKPVDFRQLQDCKATACTGWTSTLQTLYMTYGYVGSVLHGSGTVSWGRCEPHTRGTSFPPFGKKIFHVHPWCDAARASGIAVACPARQLFSHGSPSAAATAAAAVPPVPSAESLGEEVGKVRGVPLAARLSTRLSRHHTIDVWVMYVLYRTASM